MRAGDGCPCVTLRQPLPNTPYDLVVLTDPGLYQRILKGVVKEGEVAALVDRKGNFIARSLDFENRVGTPATIYVRRAAAKGGSGMYRGRTHEGMENYSAYFTTDSDWSVHVAINYQLMDSPRHRQRFVLLGGALIGLIGGGAVIVFSLMDIAARRRASARMLRLQKSEAIGRFASSVAHDFNNLLTIVIVNLERIRDAGAGADVTRRAEMGLEGARRGARLSNQLLSFARDGGAQLEVVEVAALLKRMSGLLRQSMGAGIDLCIFAEPVVGNVRANIDQLELAFLNLAINARDAMDGQGALTITAREAGGRISVTFHDTGPGIDPEIRERVFEAFFTTKTLGGTGLGLAQVVGAVSQAGGTVRLENVETGACFVLDFPAADEGG